VARREEQEDTKAKVRKQVGEKTKGSDFNLEFQETFHL
jgi:hypothetical protein